MRVVGVQVADAAAGRIVRVGTRTSVVGAIARWWWQGWQQFVSASGGRASDLVGPSPWREIGEGGEARDAE